jgi:beta-phosphoglucomutase-like phosphatase (HAD superfamily)
MFEHGKPAPDVYLRACSLLGSDPAETFAVEDSYPGLESARRAGLRVVMIPDLFPPTEETARNADYTLDSLTELQHLLMEEES